MSTWLIVLVTLAYLATSIQQAVQRNYPVSVMFFGYAVANVGILSLIK